MIDLSFHMRMTRDMRRIAAERIRQLSIDIQRVRRNIDTADDRGQPTAELQGSLNSLLASFCMAWPIYRKTSKLAALWASKHRKAQLKAGVA